MNIYSQIHAPAVVLYLALLGGSRLEFKEPVNATISPSNQNVVRIIALLYVAAALTIVSGGTIIEKSYEDLVVEGSFTEVSATLIGIVLIPLVLVMNRRWIKFALALSAMVLVLYSRRNELLGLFAVIFVTRIIFNTRDLFKEFVVILLFLFLMVFVESVRSMGLLSWLLGSEIDFLATPETKFAMPGGVGNVLISGLYVLSSYNTPSFLTDISTVQSWLFAPLPGIIFDAVGMVRPMDEHSLIFNHDMTIYVGGMPITMAFFWNFGEIGVIMLVLLVALFVRLYAKSITKVHNELSKNVTHLTQMTVFSFFCYSLVLFYLARVAFYNPQSPLRTIVYGALIYILLTKILRYRVDKVKS